jgi:uncharacterized protein (DUF488 family)
MREDEMDGVVPSGAPQIFTIGHSNHPLEVFQQLLRQHDIQVLVDVRSHPYSKYATQFNLPELRAAVTDEGIKYIFLGKELGGQPEESEYYDASGRVLYWRMAESARFLKGISRLERGIEEYKVALMCSEEDPQGCHRRLLIGRVLAERGVAVRHLRGDGSVQAEAELAKVENGGSQGQLPLFDMPEERPWTSTRSVLPRDRRPVSSES